MTTPNRRPQPAEPDVYVTINPYDIFSKWGFDDGDLLVDIAHAWAESRGMKIADGEDWRYIDRNVLLYAVYKTLVEQDGWEPVMLAATIHNPVRAKSEWVGAGRASSEPNESTPPVTISRSDVHRLAEQLFPQRSRSWMRLHNVAYDLWAHPGPDRVHFPNSGENEFQKLTFSGEVDSIVTSNRLSDEEMEVVAALLEAWRMEHAGTFETPAFFVLDEAVRTARAVLA